MGRGECEGKRILSRLHTECRAPCKAWSQDPETMTWTKTKSQLLNQLHHPGTPWALLISCQYIVTTTILYEEYPIYETPHLTIHIVTRMTFVKVIYDYVAPLHKMLQSLLVTSTIKFKFLCMGFKDLHEWIHLSSAPFFPSHEELLIDPWRVFFCLHASVHLVSCACNNMLFCCCCCCFTNFHAFSKNSPSFLSLTK